MATENEEKTKDQEMQQSESDKAMTEMYVELQNKFDEEHKARIKAENDVVQLTKIIRTMDIPKKEETKQSTINDDLNKLFG